ncbi:2-phosphosulfolactate phosphatase [Lignipirellula cremea]|uniref:Probable 2-phosphosulfolactate phosphatase n=1 Tax=Lignipirellula cremea TaxID=2528010 RepID=A0A518DX61_9BACT|nr:2-phosphosulfolactate phosphatase [Lignipirellula cremea]QDU96410.1 putative 2-phosphosulfolactate phosphatase [Lignipirellula cremea]
MQRSLDVFLLPSLATDADLEGRTAVVIDVLRATTTICYALAAGARAVIPCQEVDEARRLAGLTPGALLGGERQGVRIEGFDLGNSPTEYDDDSVAGAVILFTTTNGTRAMQRCRGARRVLLGAFVNFSALCDSLADAEEIAIVCAGTHGEITREDVLLAGAIADDVAQRRANQPGAPQGPVRFNDQAEIAADAWRALRRDPLGLSPLALTLRSSQGGRNMLELGQENDIEIAAQLDKLELVPELHLTDWVITCASPSST